MYKIMGGDQQEYGPATSEQIRQWIAQGRANGQTLATFEGSPWKPLASFPEFADALRTAAPPQLPQNPYPYSGAMQGGARMNTAAVTGLVLSILGTCCLPFSLAGLILSVIGLSQINNNPQAYSTTKVIPIAGIIIAILDIVLVIIAWSTGAFDEVMRNLPRQ